MPIPAGAGVVAAVVHFSAGEPITSWFTAILWLVAMIVVSFLMVSRWRFYSFKDIDLRSRQPFRLIIIFAMLFAAIWFYSRQVLFIIALLYMCSGIFWRLQWIFRRRRNPPPPAYKEASQVP
jgi:CDP-diacylglycerol--serine O-phosphatidyltransferase